MIQAFTAALEFDTYKLGFGRTGGIVAPRIFHNMGNWDGIGTVDMQARDPIHQLQKQGKGLLLKWDRSIYERHDVADLSDLYLQYGVGSGMDSLVKQSNGARLAFCVCRDSRYLPDDEEMADKLTHLYSFTHALSSIVTPLFEAQEFSEKLTRMDKDLLLKVLDRCQPFNVQQQWQDVKVKRRIRRICHLAGVDTIETAAAIYARSLL